MTINPDAAAPPTTSDIEIPVAADAGNALYGSDVIADTIRSLRIPYIAINPGASYRGLHDSLVNRLGNTMPQMLLCLHEEHAVAIAQGYGKVTGRAMLAAVHSNVGLMHASMAIFDAWCDRTPVIVLGATGPVDAAIRRPWIEWIHTSRDQGALIRNFVKWDDQPGSVAAARESILRAAWIAQTAPMGPVYINFDAALQEELLATPLGELDAARFMPATRSGPDPAAIRALAEMLRASRRPVILMGRVGRGVPAWDARVALAERTGARVITSHRLAAAFPTDHGLHVGAPTGGIHDEAKAALRDADLILSLDWLDLAGALAAAFATSAPPTTKIVQVSIDHHVHNGWSMDHHGLPPVDLLLAAEPDLAVAALLDHLPDARPVACPPATVSLPPPADREFITPGGLAAVLRAILDGQATSLLHVPVSWHGKDWVFRHPLDYIGEEGGGGIGAGPGIAVGAALALKESGRLPVALLGDGDFVMGCSALWTAVHYRVPLLVVIVNNQSFFNDEVHQRLMAERRGRPVANKWIGMRMTDPEIDLAALARAQGATGFGSVRAPADLPGVLEAAVAAVRAGHVAVVDVIVDMP